MEDSLGCACVGPPGDDAKAHRTWDRGRRSSSSSTPHHTTPHHTTPHQLCCVLWAVLCCAVLCCAVLRVVRCVLCHVRCAVLGVEGVVRGVVWQGGG